MKYSVLFSLIFFNMLYGCAMYDDVVTLENRISLLEHRDAKSKKYNKEIHLEINLPNFMQCTIR
jgi:hypothetical protein